MHRSVLAMSVLLFTGAVLHAQQPAPVNLRVLPKDMSRQDVVQVMRGFTRALGVRCQHCHVGEGNDLSKFDFASDEKPTKKIGRAMIAMVMDINTKHLAGIGEPAAASAPGEPPASKVTCFTCHRGETTPLSAPAAREGRGGGAWLR
jgi:photosynthetic reaction center cytochrome c subunit